MVIGLLCLCTIAGGVIGWADQLALAQGHYRHGLHSPAHPDAQQLPPEISATPEMLRGEPFSEFNHRLAGAFLVIGGLFFFFQNFLAACWKFGRYVFSVCMFLPGLYLLLLSDPKWPFGPESFWHYFTTNTQFMQHKIYAVILLIIGGTEFLRARQTWQAAWTAFIFPAVAAFAALLLLFHPHAPGHDMNSMQLVQTQHLGFAVVGGLVAVSKALSEIEWRGRGYFLRAWPVLVTLLGILLVVYRE